MNGVISVRRQRLLSPWVIQISAIKGAQTWLNTHTHKHTTLLGPKSPSRPGPSAPASLNRAAVCGLQLSVCVYPRLTSEPLKATADIFRPKLLMWRFYTGSRTGPFDIIHRTDSIQIIIWLHFHFTEWTQLQRDSWLPSY